MVDTNFPYQIVILTPDYSITGGLFLKEKRLSDFLNEKLDSTILLRNSTIARLEEPARIIEKTDMAVIPKAGMVLAFEPPQKTTPAGRQYFKYPKQKYDVFLAMDGMEVHGKLNVRGPLNVRQAITDLSNSFMPITDAIVTLRANPGFMIKREAVLVNVQRIRFIGELEPAAPPEE